MAYEPTMTVCERCETIVVKDTTGEYDATDNPGGYGGPGAPTGPGDLVTQVLGVWYPGTDQDGDPDIEIDLGALPTPTVDADGNYDWTLSIEDLGLTDVITSGIYYLRITSTYGGDTFLSEVTSLFVMDITAKVNTQMNKGEPGCGCDDPGDISRYDLFDTLNGARVAACCGNWLGAQSNVSWLYRNINLCC